MCPAWCWAGGREHDVTYLHAEHGRGRYIDWNHSERGARDLLRSWRKEGVNMVVGSIAPAGWAGEGKGEQGEDEYAGTWEDDWL